MPSKAVFHELRLLCQSPTILKSAEAVRLLRFLVEAEQAGETDKLREVLIGSELYGRDAAYDPKLDAIVRVNATRLRARLAEYYAEHPDAPLQIVLPKGSYIPRYERREPGTAVAGQAESPGETEQSSLQPAVPPIFAEAPTPVRHGGRPMLVWLAFLMSACAIGLLGWIAWRGSASGVAANGTSWIARSFSHLGGTQQFPTFSPDGRSVVFAWVRSPQQPASLYIQDVSSDTPRPLTGLPRAEDRAAWSPDGKRLALVQTEGDGLKRIVIREVPGGQETELATLKGQATWLCVMPKLSWTPDGKELFTTAEVHRSSSPAQGVADRCNITAIDLTTHTTRQVVESPADTLGDVEPTVSPDGQTLAFLRIVSYGVVDVYLLNLRENAVRRLTYDNREIMGLTWNLNGSELILASRGQDGAVRLSRRDIKTGQTTFLTDGTAPAAFPALSPTGNQIAFTSYRSNADIRLVSRTGDAAIVSDQSLKASPQISPDGRHLAFSSDRTGFAEIWIGDAGGRNSFRLTHSGGTGAQKPSWFPDSASVLFECRDQQHSQICRTGTDGKTGITRLTHWNSDQLFPTLSRDGRRLYYISNRSGRQEAYRQSLSPAGEPEQLTSGGAQRVVESWDGKAIYIQTGIKDMEFLRIPFGQGMVDTTVLTDANRAFVVFLPGFTDLSAWNAEPTGVIFCRRAGDTNELTVVDDLHSKPRVLFRISTADEIEALSVAPDGLSIVYSTRARRSGEIDLLESTLPSRNPRL